MTFGEIEKGVDLTRQQDLQRQKKLKREQGIWNRPGRCNGPSLFSRISGLFNARPFRSPGRGCPDCCNRGFADAP